MYAVVFRLSAFVENLIHELQRSSDHEQLASAVACLLHETRERHLEIDSTHSACMFQV